MTGVTTSWIEVLLTQGADLPEDNTSRGSYQQAFALILRGELSRYHEYAGEHGSWPPLRATEHPDDSDRALLVALLRHIQGFYDDAAERHRSLLTADHPVDIRVVAAALASMALSETDHYREAVELLDATSAALGRTSGDVPPATADRWEAGSTELRAGAALLALHRGWRRAERANWDEAISVTETAIQPSLPAPQAAVLQYVAEHNLVAYRRKRSWERDEVLARPAPWPSEAAPEAFRTRERDIRSALQQRLEYEVHRTFGTGERRFTFDDRADHQLWAAAFRDECLANTGGLPSTRTMLGTHRLLQAAADPTTDPTADDFRLLLEGHASRSLERAVRWFYRRGPVNELADLIERVALREWLPHHQQATLALLRTGGGLLDPERADSVIERLKAMSRVNTSGWHPRYEGLRALRAVLDSASDAGHYWAAAWLLEEAAESSDEVIIRAATQAARALRWDALNEDLRSQAYRFINAHLHEEAGPKNELAAALLLYLAPLNPDRASRTLTSASGNTPTPVADAVALDAGIELEPALLDGIADRALRRLLREREETAKGRWEFGGVNDALLLTVALLRGAPPALWGNLFEYLADDSVADRHKVGPLNVLADNIDALPAGAMEHAVAMTQAGITGVALEPGDDLLAGPSLRFELALSTIQVDTARDRLLKLGTDADLNPRIEAAWTLPLAWSDLAPDVRTLAMVLARDTHHEVRAASGTALSRLPIYDDLASYPWVRDELLRLLQDPGVLAPLSVLEALASREEPLRLPETVMQVIAEGATRAKAARIRRAARRVLDTQAK